MKIALVKTPVDLSRHDQFCYVVSAGIYSLASLCRCHGYGVSVSDPATWPQGDNWEDGLLDWIGHDADVVGFSAHTFNWAATRQAVNQLKKIAPDKTVIVGGVHPTHLPQHVLKASDADFVIQGEAEVSLLKLLEALATGSDYSDIPGLGFRSDEKIIVNDIALPLDLTVAPPFVPAYELLPANKYYALVAETSRGCFWRCTFCSIPTRERWRPLTVADAVDQIVGAYDLGRNRVTSTTMFLADDCFTTDKKRARQICQQLRDKNTSARLAIEARANDLLTDDIVCDLKSINPKMVQVGVECGYDRGLELVGKKTTIDRVKRCAHLLYKHNLTDCEFSFIIGLPWEDESDCMKTISFAAELVSEYGFHVNVSWWTPLPSRLWQQRDEYGIDLDVDIWDEPGWQFTDKTFWAPRPRLSHDAKQRIDDRFDTYKQMGIRLRFP